MLHFLHMHFLAVSLHWITEYVLHKKKNPFVSFPFFMSLVKINTHREFFFFLMKRAIQTLNMSVLIFQTSIQLVAVSMDILLEFRNIMHLIQKREKKSSLDHVPKLKLSLTESF